MWLTFHVTCRSAGSVILESPVLPVADGKAVTLRCRSKSTSTNTLAVFYKNGHLVKSFPSGEMTIHSVSKSHEGLYKCNISGVGESTESRLAVRARTVSVTPQKPHEDPHSGDSNGRHVSILLWIAVTILITALLLVGLLNIRKHRVSKKPTATTSSGEENQK
ncbi:low affinity immunoglobulin gamma Fc region receptor II-a-like, partial [Plectropomus leopardus]|uniref:low affinity immunoglobulin gamma Fc region receptor II-a-like n=1 Tax=Plectropomus leopardus TaxID=160734 RepID=UPI001C4CB58E